MKTIPHGSVLAVAALAHSLGKALAFSPVTGAVFEEGVADAIENQQLENGMPFYRFDVDGRLTNGSRNASIVGEGTVREIEEGIGTAIGVVSI